MGANREVEPSPSLATARTSSLNSRRILARLLDGLVLTAATVLLTHLITGIGLLVASLWVTVAYFFLLESTTGQTVGKHALGLRVVRRDGGPPGANEIATRNVIRLFEEPILALLVLLGSGRRRQRLGDLAAGTTVGVERASVRPYPSPAQAIYPLVWGALGLAVVLSAGEPSPPPSFDRAASVTQTRADAAAYLERLQSLCRARDLVIRRNWHTSSAFMVRHELAFTRRVAAVPAPNSMLGLRRRLLVERRKVDRITRQMHRETSRSPTPGRLFDEVFRPKLKAASYTSNQAFVSAGLACSTGEGPLP